MPRERARLERSQGGGAHTSAARKVSWQPLRDEYFFVDALGPS